MKRFLKKNTEISTTLSIVYLDYILDPLFPCLFTENIIHNLNYSIHIIVKINANGRHPNIHSSYPQTFITEPFSKSAWYFCDKIDKFNERNVSFLTLAVRETIKKILSDLDL